MILDKVKLQKSFKGFTQYDVKETKVYHQLGSIIILSIKTGV